MLARYEPFVELPQDAAGPLELVGPDAEGASTEGAGWPDELIPIGRWAGLRPNVC